MLQVIIWACSASAARSQCCAFLGEVVHPAHAQGGPAISEGTTAPLAGPHSGSLVPCRVSPQHCSSALEMCSFLTHVHLMMVGYHTWPALRRHFSSKNATAISMVANSLKKNPAEANALPHKGGISSLSSRKHLSDYVCSCEHPMPCPDICYALECLTELDQRICRATV